MTKRNLKKLLALGMAAMMTVSTGVTTFAANTDDNLVVTGDTLYSTQIQSGKKVTLGLLPANSSYSRTGFDSLADAEKGLKVTKINAGADKISNSFTYGSKTSDGLYAGTVEVTGSSDVYGSASIHVANAYNETAGIDMTVYVEAKETRPDVTVASVEAVDLTEYGTTYEWGEDLTVQAATKTADNPFKDSDGAAQSYPTVGDALYSLAATNGCSFIQYEGYVNSVTDSTGKNLKVEYLPETKEYYGWEYCVVRDGKVMSDRDILSASVLEVKDGDKVYWAYGTKDQIADYFGML